MKMKSYNSFSLLVIFPREKNKVVERVRYHILSKIGYLFAPGGVPGSLSSFEPLKNLNGKNNYKIILYSHMCWNKDISLNTFLFSSCTFILIKNNI